MRSETASDCSVFERKQKSHQDLKSLQINRPSSERKSLCAIWIYTFQAEPICVPVNRTWMLRAGLASRPQLGVASRGRSRSCPTSQTSARTKNTLFIPNGMARKTHWCSPEPTQRRRCATPVTL